MSNSTSPFTFRASKIAGRNVVFVFSGSNIYTVTAGRHHATCNCPHYIHRCAGTLKPCKHIAASQEWQRTQEAPAPAVRRTLDSDTIQNLRAGWR
jgi:predicted nucleic acid-binding Zn finger protein